MSVIVATAAEERGILLTREIVLPRLRPSSVMRFAVVQIGTPTISGFGRRRLGEVRWLVAPGPCNEQTLLAAPVGEDVYWGCDSAALAQDAAALYGAMEAIDPSDDVAREIRASAIAAQRALDDAGLPVVMSISHDMDLLVVAGPEGWLRPLMTPSSQ